VDRGHQEALVCLLFFEFKLLPWNKASQGLTVLISVIHNNTVVRVLAPAERIELHLALGGSFHSTNDS